jgi:NAD-dependent dihydropyrimidine dehydrogenase PreA subunit
MIVVEPYKCGYCGACVSVCPNNCIDLIEVTVKIDENCVNCGICTIICPIGALRLIKYGQ